MINCVIAAIGTAGNDINIVKEVISVLACPTLAFFLYGRGRTKPKPKPRYRFIISEGEELRSPDSCMLEENLMLVPEPEIKDTSCSSLFVAAIIYGILLATVICVFPIGLLGWFSYGYALPNVLAVIIGIGLCIIFLIGSEVDVTGNLLIDSFGVSVPVAVFAFVIVSGFFALPQHITRTGIYGWVVLFLICSIVIRLITFAKEGM